MFKKEDIESIDRRYFTVIVANEYDITLVSNNAHHVWYYRSDAFNRYILKTFDNKLIMDVSANLLIGEIFLTAATIFMQLSLAIKQTSGNDNSVSVLWLCKNATLTCGFSFKYL